MYFYFSIYMESQSNLFQKSGIPNLSTGIMFMVAPILAYQIGEGGVIGHYASGFGNKSDIVQYNMYQFY